ncbi:ankyrin repeat and SOCS box protein 13-like [Sycon ciliatum]|uniref:ankyrin repeat and SOCS box protein 13-like n=1 Tax=Sycon ciliatum TaxID=27933 RepID=UPI0031F6CE38
MAPVIGSQVLRYARQDNLEDLKAKILEGGVFKEEVKLHKDGNDNPLLAMLLKDACSHKATSVVKFLASTVDKHMLNHQGYYSLPTVSTIPHYGSALHAAVSRGSVDCLRYLLDAGAHTNVTDLNRRTPLHDATMKNQADCVLHLLQAGANPDERDQAGYGTAISIYSANAFPEN